MKEVLSGAGFSLDDVVSWGGEVRYDAGCLNSPKRLGAVQRGEADMISDEAVRSWVNAPVESNMRILPFDEPLLGTSRRTRLPSGSDSQGELHQIEEDVPTLDFSGFPVYTHVNVPDAIVTSICSALEARKEKSHGKKKARYPWIACVVTHRKDRSIFPFTPRRRAFLARTRLSILDFEPERCKRHPQSRLHHRRPRRHGRESHRSLLGASQKAIQYRGC